MRSTKVNVVLMNISRETIFFSWSSAVMQNRPLHDGRGMMGNQGKNYSEWSEQNEVFRQFLPNSSISNSRLLVE